MNQTSLDQKRLMFDEIEENLDDNLGSMSEIEHETKSSKSKNP